MPAGGQPAPGRTPRHGWSCHPALPCPCFAVLRVWAPSATQPVCIGVGAGPELSLLRGPLSSPSPASRARWQIPCRSTAVQLYCRRPGFDVFLTALESQPLFFHPALPRERLSASPCPTTTFEPAAGFQTGLMEGQRSQRYSSQQGWWARGAGGARGETKTWLLCRRDNGLRAAVANLWRKREKI